MAIQDLDTYCRKVEDKDATKDLYALLTIFFEVTSDAVFFIREQEFVECNASTLKLFGCSSKAEFCGKSLIYFSPLIQPCGETSASLAQKYVEKALLERNFRFEWLYRRLDGVEFRAEVLLSAEEIAGQSILQAVVRDISRNIKDSTIAAEQLRQQAQREELLNHLTKQIRSSLDFDTILSTAVQEIRKFLQIDRCNYAWYNHEEQEPYWEVVQECRHPELPDLSGRYLAEKLGPLPQKLLSLEILWINDVEQITDEIYKNFVSSLGFKSLLAIPMRVSSGVIGVVSCSQSREKRVWTYAEVDFLQAVMAQLAIALTQAELYQQSRAKTQELEQTLQQLKYTQAQLVQSEKMSSLGQLVAGVAHEINNPVNFIHGNIGPAKDYIQNLLDLINLYQKNYPEVVSEISELAEAIDLEFVMEDLPKLLESMKIGTQRIRDIVLSLRTFSRLDEAEFKKANIHENLDSALMILQYRIKAKEYRPAIQVIKKYANIPLIECFAGQLNQVFMNILVNAIDALDERDEKRTIKENQENPSTIIITTETTLKNDVIVRIQDNANGIPLPVQQRLFDPFFTTKAVGKGTGMGLSISYQIISERHGGKLDCISEPGNGAEFVIEIPVEQVGE